MCWQFVPRSWARFFPRVFQLLLDNHVILVHERYQLSFQYVGTIINKKLTFDKHADMVYKKSQQRLFLLRKHKSFEVRSHVLQLVYIGLVDSILSFNSITWFGHLTVTQKKKLGRVVNISSKLISQQQRQLSTLHDSTLARKAFQIFY